MSQSRKTALLYIVCGAVFCSMFVLSILFGSVAIPFDEFINALKGDKTVYYTIVWDIRMPRTLAAALAGVALAAAGSILQCVTDNPLCAPNIIGVNSGAGLFVMIILCLMPSQWMLLPFAAFIGALLATAVVMGISFTGGGRTGGTSIVLAGVAVSSILSAGISFLSLRYPDVLSTYTSFSVGGFSGVGYKDILIPFIIIVFAAFVLQLLCPKLNLLCLGDDIAYSLGVKVKTIRIASLVLAAALCAGAVSFAGLLGFVGLIVPNITKQIAGSDMRFNLSLSALMGGGIVMFSDLLGRVLFAPAELPAGIIMALFGSPFFLYLLIKRRNRYGRM